MSTTASTIVLDHNQITDRIRRMAWQIYEDHQDEKEIILAGIVESGYLLAAMLRDELASIAPFKVSLHRIKVDKKNPLSRPAVLEPDTGNLKGKAVLVIDDVLNTGSTLIHGVKHFLEFEVSQIKTIVLVDRNHKNFPVKADIKGMSLSTNLMEHVEVQIGEKPFTVVVS